MPISPAGPRYLHSRDNNRVTICEREFLLYAKADFRGAPPSAYPSSRDNRSGPTSRYSGTERLLFTGRNEANYIRARVFVLPGHAEDSPDRLTTRIRRKRYPRATNAERDVITNRSCFTRNATIEKGADFFIRFSPSRHCRKKWDSLVHVTSRVFHIVSRFNGSTLVEISRGNRRASRSLHNR